jgi:hypothetical protein
MMKWAVIHNNKVIDNVMWSGLNDWVYPFAHDHLIENKYNSLVIGMYYEDGEWKMPLNDTINWLHPEYSMRIVAPVILATEYPDILFELTVREKLPIEEVEDNIYIYCNSIDPKYQDLFDELEGVVSIETQENE